MDNAVPWPEPHDTRASEEGPAGLRLSTGKFGTATVIPRDAHHVWFSPASIPLGVLLAVIGLRDLQQNAFG